ncbi:sensor histidine kinase [Vulgatibacter incomptus]|uniref:histidine kinase n=1 Tax=Vulgatibacter incomptus TaxID=1391653 RepID=A0A0K1PDZ1_9BACT|nr:sensor histidine kinase [Vulgatibacter incomptus]AKU91753.1 Two component sensor histidine kinase [Vulgatibacter incomptus]
MAHPARALTSPRAPVSIDAGDRASTGVLPADLLSSWRERRLAAHSRTLSFLRLAAIIVGVCVAAVPGWAAALGLDGVSFRLVLGAMVAYTLAAAAAIPRGGSEPGRLSTAVTYAALCLDAAVAAYVIAATGGLRSPLLAVQVGLAASFALLFPRPLLAAPAFLVLPALARIDRALGTTGGSLFEILTVVGYGALDLAIVLLIVEANRREEERLEQLVRLERALGELAVANERARLSREIHDGLGASLSSLSLQTQYLLQLCPDGALRAEIEELRLASGDALEELRHALHVMRGDFDLARASREHCAAIERRCRLPIRFEQEGEAPAAGEAGELHLTLFRLLQEAVSNAVKHAGPTRIEVRLAFAPGSSSLTVRDDGAGFDPDAPKAGHYGLRGMRERAKRCGGEVWIESSLGAGACVRVEFPNRERPPAAA